MGSGAVITRLSASECLALLSQAHIGRLVLSIDALPAARSVKFRLVDRKVVVRVAPDSRLCRAANGTVVAFQADHFDHIDGEGWSVVAHGIGEEMNDPREVSRLQAELPDQWSQPPSQDIFLQIPISLISGERVLWPSPPT